MDEKNKKCKSCELEKDAIKCFYIYNSKHFYWDLNCTQCISEHNKARRYKEQCENCGSFSRLDCNKNCKKCNKTAGLYQCRTCEKILPLVFAFDGKHRQCKWCMKEKRKNRK